MTSRKSNRKSNKNRKSKVNKNHFSNIIVGGGISGLYTAYHILKNIKTTKNKKKVLVLESSNQLGGRVQSYLDNKSKIQYEKGAARFSMKHKRLIKLIKELGLNNKMFPITNDVSYLPYPDNLYSQYQEKYPTFDDLIDDLTYHLKKKNVSNSKLLNINLLEAFDAYLPKLKSVTSKNNIPVSKFAEARYQYFSELYHFNAVEALRTFKQDFNLKVQYFVLGGGLTQIINILSDKIKKMGGVIKTNFHISDIQEIKDNLNINSYANSNANSNTIDYSNSKIYKLNNTFTCDNLVLALTTQALQSLHYIKNNKTLFTTIKSVNCRPLYRIYARYPKGKNGKVWFHDIGKVSTNLPIKFIIPYQEEKGVIMISYTDDKYADFWMKKNIESTPEDDIFQKELDKQLNKIFPKQQIPKPIWVKHYYWKCGVGYWTKGNNSQILMPQILHPNKKENLYITNENFSQFQAWMEGALQTSDFVIKKIYKKDKIKKKVSKKNSKKNSKKSSNKVGGSKKNKKSNKKTPPSKKGYTIEEVRKHRNTNSAWLVIKGKVYDVTQWRKKHPGGDVIMQGVKVDDATSLFENRGHSDFARKKLKELFIGKLIKKK
tara:strand:+ start:5457 stop:7262 length:1806 start_codon:yes stop_codon:yes gene_type:complete